MTTQSAMLPWNETYGIEIAHKRRTHTHKHRQVQPYPHSNSTYWYNLFSSFIWGRDWHLHIRVWVWVWMCARLNKSEYKYVHNTHSVYIIFSPYLYIYIYSSIAIVEMPTRKVNQSLRKIRRMRFINSDITTQARNECVYSKTIWTREKRSNKI